MIGTLDIILAVLAATCIVWALRECGWL